MNELYPLIDINHISIVERPDENDTTKIFYNPRSLESFTPEEMAELRSSIQKNGLQQPLIVRVITHDKTKTGQAVVTELIAGERRFRTLSGLYKSNPLCYSPEQDKELPAKELYAKVPCKVYYNISDEKALTLAYIENKERKDLTIKEEIALIERLVASGKTVKEVAALLDTNITLVSQFSNFRKELPKEAFEKLINGKLSKHVAVKILSFQPEDRQKLFEATLEEAEKEHEELTNGLQSQLEELEDAQEIHETVAGSLDEDDKKRNTKKQVSLTKQVEVVKDKIKRAKTEKGVVRQSALLKGAESASVVPKKASTSGVNLDIHQFYVKLPNVWLKNGKSDPVSGNEIPADIIEVMVETAKSILGGENSPLNVVHRIMVARGLWEAEEEMILDAPSFDVSREETNERNFEDELE